MNKRKGLITKRNESQKIGKIESVPIQSGLTFSDKIVEQASRLKVAQRFKVTDTSIKLEALYSRIHYAIYDSKVSKQILGSKVDGLKIIRETETNVVFIERIK